MIKCKICSKEYKSIQPLSEHITSKHNYNKQDYYDLYMLKEGEGICKQCNKNKTHFYGMNRGYNKFCSKKCQVKNELITINAHDYTKERKQFEIANNCTRKSTLKKKYGVNWCCLKLQGFSEKPTPLGVGWIALL